MPSRLGGRCTAWIDGTADTPGTRGHMPARNAIKRVNDVMSSAPTSVQTSTTIELLLELFDRHDFNAFPVTNAVNELVGIVTKVDLLRALRPTEALDVREGTRAAAMSAGEIMRTSVI